VIEWPPPKWQMTCSGTFVASSGKFAPGDETAAQRKYTFLQVHFCSPLILPQHHLPWKCSEFLQYPTDEVSMHGDNAELFERDVNTLNRCFDDIERFVARIQSAAFAQRELEQQDTHI
ncbi:hypothetical protein ANCDUO_25118, partial [Ancylostoma duodenale]